MKAGENVDRMHVAKKARRDKGFIFTTDAVLVLPLVILIITAFIAFSVTLRENTFFHEYAFVLARDQLAYLSDLPYGASGLPVIAAIMNASISGNDQLALDIANTSISVPSNMGYVLERFDVANNRWITIAEKKLDRYKYNAGSVRLVTVLAGPYLEINGQKVSFSPDVDYLAGYDCGNDVTCIAPATSFYRAGVIFGPALVRLRIQI
jgi:hypothetical protein